MLGFEQSRPLIKPNKRALLRKVLRGNEYDNSRELELNYDKGIRGWQIKIYNKQGEAIRRFCFTHETDVIEFFIEIHDPGFNWWYHDINPLDVDKVLLLITQSLTTGPGSTQNFSVPITWGNNTSSCIGGAGNGAAGTAVGIASTGGGAGGGGAYSDKNVQGIDRNSTAPYFIGSAAQQTWFSSALVLLADNGTSASGLTKGLGGLVANCVGTNKRSGGDGGNATTSSSGSTVQSNSGAGAGAAAGTSGNGSNGNNGVNATGVTNASSGKGGDSDTVSGGASTTGNGNVGADGTDFDASHGAGAGASGGGCLPAGPTVGNGANGGLYGAGGAGGGSIGGPGAKIGGSAGLGRQGMIFLSWVPYAYSEVYGTN